MAEDGADVFTLVRVEAGAPADAGLGRSLARIPGVVEVHSVAGASDFVVRWRIRNFEEVVGRLHRIRSIRGVATTQTLLSVSRYREGEAP